MRAIVILILVPIMLTFVLYYSALSQYQDKATKLAIDVAGNIYVTGNSLNWDSVYSPGWDIVTIKCNPSGAILWAKRYDGPESIHDKVNDIATDPWGNVYVVGYSKYTNSNDDYVTIKYNPSGDLQWVRTYNGPGNGDDTATGVGIDAAGNVYVTGDVYIEGQNYELPFSGLKTDFATIKYNPAGDEQWVAQYNGPGNGQDNTVGIAVDATGNVYVVGVSEHSETGGDYTTIKYNTNGEHLWTARYSGFANSHYHDYPFDMTIDDAGNVYVTGFTDSPGTGTYDFSDYGTIKYNSTGQQQWVALYNGPENGADYASAVAVDRSGNVFVTGSSGLVHEEDYATVKYNSSGQQQWCIEYNGIADASDHGRAIVTDDSENANVYVTGCSEGTHYCSDYVTLKYSSSGVQQWVERYNGALDAYDYATDIIRSPSGYVYVTGYSQVVSTYEDIVTIKYNQASGQVQWYLVYDGGSGIGIESYTDEVPQSYELCQNYPNPFNPSTQIMYSLPKLNHVILKIFNIHGKAIKTLVNEFQTAGKKSVTWDGLNEGGQKVSSGIYIYQLNIGDFTTSKKMIMVQ